MKPPNYTVTRLRPGWWKVDLTLPGRWLGAIEVRGSREKARSRGRNTARSWLRREHKFVRHVMREMKP